HQAGADRIEILNKNDGYCVRLLHDRRSRGGRNDDDNAGLQCHELSCQGLHCVDRTAGPTLFDPNVAALRPSQCLQSLNERTAVAKPFGVTCNFPPQYGNLWQTCQLLRARRERPCGRAAKQRDELAALHSITSSARTSSVTGTSRPSAFAVLMLITVTNLVACSTGMSA